MKKPLRIGAWLAILYFLVAWSFPHWVAWRRGGSVVSSPDWRGDSIERTACLNGSSVIYPHRATGKSLEFVAIDQSNNRISLFAEIHERFSRCLSGEDVTVVAWNESVNEERERTVSLISYRNGTARKQNLTLPPGPYALHVTDMENGYLLGHIKQVVGPDSIDGGLFIVSVNGLLSFPPVGTGEHIESGYFWSKGIVYRDDKRVILRTFDGHQKTLGDIREGEIYTKTNDSVAWTSYRDGVAFVHGFSNELGSWRYRGAFPFLFENKLLVVDRELGGVFVIKLNDGRRKLLLASAKARSPVYHEGRLYWEEEIINFKFPIQLVFYLFGGEVPQTEESHLFAKNMPLI